MIAVVHTRTELASNLDRAPGEIAVVMTMGALHAGHRMLMREAKARGAFVVVTIFVNPLQFGPNEDFEKYPRTLEADVEACRAEGVDLVFAPSRDDVYPGGPPSITMNAGPLGEILEGASRPGHFAGMLTVVQKLLMLTRAEVAFFGEKDFQQLTLIRQMVRDLDMPVEIVGVPTWRDEAGLALSSRNRYLSTEQGPTALHLSQALAAGIAAAPLGREAVLDAARTVLTGTPGLTIDRLDLVDPDSLTDATTGAARLLVAAILPGPFGPIRLIDNAALTLPSLPLPIGMA
jgi:pantoate--beta-alanine ligase